MTKITAIAQAKSYANYFRTDRVVFARRTSDGLEYGCTSISVWHGQGNAPVERARIVPTLGRRTLYYVQTIQPS